MVLEASDPSFLAVNIRPHELWSLPEANDFRNFYYRFLHRIASKATPENPFTAIEVGTYLGTATAHLAANTSCNVHTIELNNDLINQAKRLHKGAGILDGRTTFHWGDSIACLTNAITMRVCPDLIFIDGEHSHSRVTDEADLAALLAADGVVLFDDLLLNDDMKRFWSELPGEKLELHHLHYTGFGAWWPGGGE